MKKAKKKPVRKLTMRRIEIPLRIPVDQLAYVDAVSVLAGVTRNDVFNVILAIQILKWEKAK
jgi:hypothetical protein